MSYYLNQIPIMLMALPVILISLSVHEASHGYAAYKLGDPTAKKSWQTYLKSNEAYQSLWIYCHALLQSRLGKSRADKSKKF